MTQWGSWIATPLSRLAMTRWGRKAAHVIARAKPEAIRKKLSFSPNSSLLAYNYTLFVYNSSLLARISSLLVRISSLLVRISSLLVGIFTLLVGIPSL
jgi:hypothetical protein